eukprot:COSAG06_NODE_916_length_11564_cov_7.148190_3_plen_118_part_00
MKAKEQGYTIRLSEGKEQIQSTKLKLLSMRCTFYTLHTRRAGTHRPPANENCRCLSYELQPQPASYVPEDDAQAWRTPQQPDCWPAWPAAWAGTGGGSNVPTALTISDMMVFKVGVS